MSYEFSFEKLDVWKLAKNLCINIYDATKGFPDYEKFGLRSQLTRAAVSVVSNIAEGTSRMGSKEQARFTQISYGSMMEVACQLIIARDMGYIAEELYDELRTKVEEITNMLNSLHKYQVSRR